jgi:hypothetical protein
MGSAPKIKPPSVAAPQADDPTTAVTTLVKRARNFDVARRATAAAGSGAYQGKTLLGSGIR